MANSIAWTRTDGHITIHRRAAAEAVIGWSISQIDLFNITKRREVLSSLKHFDDASAALTDTTAIVEVIQSFVRIDTSRESRFAQVGTLNAANLLAFLLKTDSGHGSFTSDCGLIYKLHGCNRGFCRHFRQSKMFFLKGVLREGVLSEPMTDQAEAA